MRARAAEGLAKLEATERGSTSIGGSAAGQIARQRQIKERRDQVRTLEWLLAVMDHEDVALPLEPSQPERIVAQVDQVHGWVYCNQPACYGQAGWDVELKGRTSADLADCQGVMPTTQCRQCNRSVCE